MARPNWEYIRVDVLLPSHPKLAGASPAVLGVLVAIWCYCGQYLTDGFVAEEQWRKFGTVAMRHQVVQRGFATPVDGGYRMHDYLGHQRSREEATDLSAKRRVAGSRGGHAKASALANRVASAKQVLAGLPGLPEPVDNSAGGVDGGVDNADPESLSRSLSGSMTDSSNFESESSNPAKSREFPAQPTLAPASKRSKNVAEAEAEAEADLLVADLVTSPHVPNARDYPIDDDLIQIITTTISEHTKAPVPSGHAAAIARQLLAGRDVTDPAAYATAAIRADPQRFTPARIPPRSDHAEQRNRARAHGAGPPPAGLLDGLRRQLTTTEDTP